MVKKNNNSKNLLIAGLVVSVIAILVLSFLLVNSKMEVAVLSEQVSSLQQDVSSQLDYVSELESNLSSSLGEINELKDRSDVLEQIVGFQKEAQRHTAQSENIAANLIDYEERWSETAVGSAAEERALQRYKEELDKLKLVLDENNQLFTDNEDMLRVYLSINSDQVIADNNLAYDMYEDAYFDMLNYE